MKVTTSSMTKKRKNSKRMLSTPRRRLLKQKMRWTKTRPPVAVPVGRARKVEQVEVHSAAARAAQRDSIAADVEAFLKRGGSIKQITDDDRTDPPKKSENNYGRGSA